MLLMYLKPKKCKGQLHSWASSTRSFNLRTYSTTSKLTSKEAQSGGQSNSKTSDAVVPPAKKPLKVSRSISAARASFRAGQQKTMEKSRDTIQKKAEQDPEFAINYMASMSRQAVGVDVWSRTAQTLDVEIPKENNYISGLNALKYLWDNRSNIVKNAVSLSMLVNSKALPPLYALPEYPYGNNSSAPPSTAPDKFSWYKLSHIRQALGVGSTRSDAWAAGIPGLSLHLYMQMCQAIAENDKATLKRVACHEQLDNGLQILRNRDPNWVYDWKLHKVNTPCRIVSLRVSHGYTASAEPGQGLNRLFINALVRFDTIQSLEVVSKRKSGQTQVVKPTPKRVLEYLIMEKKGWVPTSWCIRQRLYDTSLVGEPLGRVEDKEPVV